ncbi:Phage protein [plant metagenome]|uniref:Phage protein n=1 Tax=plant metagenome TaxID=1297885 RepID=A0A484TDD8_9ZZZZ
MSAELSPLDLSPLMALIRIGVPALRLVGGAADYATAKDLRGLGTPSAYVLMARESAQAVQPGKPARLGSQVIDVQFGVAIALRNYRDQAGAQMEKEVRQVVGGIRQVVLGWTPDVPGARMCGFVQGDVLDYDDSTLLWVDVFRTQRLQ